ncbi:MAG: WbuC family cupin fold metalloprotein [Bacteroidota bacterium]
MIRTDNKLLSEIVLQAKQSQRKRMNFNFHRNNDAILQRMLNALEPESYIRPHKHVNPDKNEVFVVLQGKLLLVEFDDEGAICETVVLDSNLGNHAVEIPPNRFHTIISLESGSVAFEFKEGPYDVATDKVFASWAPEEGGEGAQLFLRTILDKTL